MVLGMAAILLLLGSKNAKKPRDAQCKSYSVTLHGVDEGGIIDKHTRRANIDRKIFAMN